jgi:hypothetical protein
MLSLKTYVMKISLNTAMPGEVDWHGSDEILTRASCSTCPS